MTIEIVVQVIAIIAAVLATVITTLGTLAVTILIFIFKIAHGEMIRSINGMRDDFNGYKKEQRRENSDLHKRIDDCEKNREDGYKEISKLITGLKEEVSAITALIKSKKRR